MINKLIKISLGAGQVNHGKDWIHIDALEYKHIKYHDVTKLPFAACSVDEILASHLIAYFDRQEIVSILQHWYDVLKFGGKIRIATPDLKILSYLIWKKDVKDEEVLGPLYGKISGFTGSVYHKTCYSYDGLKGLLQQIGFKDIKRYDWRKEEKKYINDQQKCYWPKRPELYKTGNFDTDQILIGLNVKAIK